MATHFICQSTEPLPHTFPTGLAQKTHGPVSQYEAYNDAKKPHTQFPYPGWDFSLTSEEDSLPLIQPMSKPEWKNTCIQPDPTLCVTPIKPQPASRFSDFTKHSVDPDPLLCITPEKSVDHNVKFSGQGQRSDDVHVITNKDKKVRFDVEETNESLCYGADGSYLDPTISQNLNSFSAKKVSPEKPYKPELYGDGNSDCGLISDSDKDKDNTQMQDSNTNARTVCYTIGKVNNQAVYVPLTSNLDADKTNTSESKTLTNPAVVAESKNTCATKSDVIPKQACLKSKTIKVVREKQRGADTKVKPSEADPIAASRPHRDSSNPKRRVKVLRENQYGPKLDEYTYPFDQNRLENGGEEHMFARPEYNSTLKMKIEAEKLRESEINVEVALERKLKLSETTKAGISEKAASMVNADKSAYSGLVSLEVPVDKLCEQAAELKTARAKQVKVPKSEIAGQREPDLMEFFTPDLQRETVTYSLPTVPAPSEQLSTVSHWRAFDLYRHNRVWEGRSFSYKRK